MDVATNAAVTAFAAGTLKAGIQTGNAANGGIGLAPYHDWDSKIPQTCKDKVTAAVAGLKNGSIQTGYTP
jgi:basic membrane protein A and related proteins